MEKKNTSVGFNWCFDPILTSVGSSAFQKKFTTTGSANTCNFFLKMKKFDFKKKYNYGIKAPLKSHSCIFFEIKIFSFPKKITSVG